MLAIIGGSGLTQLSNMKISRREVVRTPYGEPSSALTFGSIAGLEVVFLARHGYGHTIPPHQVNYCANIWALHAQGAKNVVSIASVGGITGEFKHAALAVPDLGVHHIDFTLPYCQTLRAACLKAAQQAGETLIDGGVYAATQGPRLETAAEINRLERDGADMVGMTGMPEAALAREIGLCYAVIAVVANYAAGRGGSARGIAMNEITAVLEQAMGRVRRILEKLVVSDGG